ncbi:MAG: hypothetical protein KDK07_02450 [Bauldia sp.]|nr:hypothetical protein [Bauldia sp.]
MSKGKGSGDPPVDNRFKKGTSGNPKGRPRKRLQETTGSAFDILIDKTLTITRNGVAREATVEEAIQHRTYQDAIAGNRSAIKEVLKMIAKRDKALAARRKPKIPSFKRLVEYDPDNADEAMLILGIACRDDRWVDRGFPDRLLLETWAVRVALGRRKGGRRLTGNEIADINRCTREPDKVRWPRGTPE